MKTNTVVAGIVWVCAFALMGWLVWMTAAYDTNVILSGVVCFFACFGALTCAAVGTGTGNNG